MFLHVIIVLFVFFGMTFHRTCKKYKSNYRIYVSDFECILFWFIYLFSSLVDQLKNIYHFSVLLAHICSCQLSSGSKTKSPEFTEVSHWIFLTVTFSLIRHSTFADWFNWRINCIFLGSIILQFSLWFIYYAADGLFNCIFLLYNFYLLFGLWWWMSVLRFD